MRIHESPCSTNIYIILYRNTMSGKKSSDVKNRVIQNGFSNDRIFVFHNTLILLGRQRQKTYN